MTHTAKGTFQIKMQPHAPEGVSSAEISRMYFHKTWEGALSGVSQGEFLSVGDPRGGSAAYVVMEVFGGELDGRKGTFAFHQYGALISGKQTLVYEIVPGSGSGELTDIAGTLTLDEVENVHHYTLSYEVNP